MEEVAGVLSKEKISISNLAVYNNSRGIEVVVMTDGYNDVSKKLKEAGFNVTSVIRLHREY